MAKRKGTPTNPFQPTDPRYAQFETQPELRDKLLVDYQLNPSNPVESNMPQQSGAAPGLPAPDLTQNITPPESAYMQPIGTNFAKQGNNPYLMPQGQDTVNNLPSAVPNVSSPHDNLMGKLFPNGVTPSDVYDVARLGIGLNGALKTVPQYSKSPAWNDYVNRAQQMSRQGFSPQEYSLANRNADQAYNGDVYSVNNLSGGNAGVALGNLGRAANSLYGAKAMLAARDAELQRQNFNQYGGILDQDNQQNRQIFEDKANQIMESKRAGAQLANDAIYNLKQNGQYAKNYGDNSLYSKYMKGLVDKQELENKNLKLSQQNFGESFAPKTVQTPPVNNLYYPAPGATTSRPVDLPDQYPGYKKNIYGLPTDQGAYGY